MQIIDIRTPQEYGVLALPGSRNVAVREFFNKESAPLFSQRHVKKVIVGNDETEERAACGLLHELGYENLALLRGGFGSFSGTILQPTSFIPTGSRWDADVRQFRTQARVSILTMIEEGRKSGVKETRKVKKIQGGC
jgi:rhodanese-related sulfurtransferase